MLGLLGLALTFLAVAAYLHFELRSSLYGVTLSNGLEVLVSPELYREIVHQYRTLDEPDATKRWDQAVLKVIRPRRPKEWRFLVRSLGQQFPSESLGTRRQRQTVHG
jgi:hypothetical protein